MSGAPPGFVGVGAQRAGTTWWFRLLLQHPAILRSTAALRELSPIQTTKELHFFNRFSVREMEDADIAAYHALFPSVPGAVRGEWTPRYLYDPLTARLLRRAAPGARILVMLRDPVERYRSGLAHQFGYTPNRPPEGMVAEAVYRSRYAAQLRRYLELFPAEQVLILQYERCRRQTTAEYRRTLRFLGVDDRVEPRDAHERRGPVTAAPKQTLSEDQKQELRAVLEPDVRELLELVPDIDPGLWPHFEHLAGPARVPAAR